jgi:hypothetical protein
LSKLQVKFKVTVHSTSHCVVKSLVRETEERESADRARFVILDRQNLTVKFGGSSYYIHIEREKERDRSEYSSVIVHILYIGLQLWICTG